MSNETKPLWSYERREREKLNHGHVEKRVTHVIFFKDKVVSRTQGTDELEGARCRELVERCNREGVEHNPTLVGADIPSSSSRGEKLTQASEARVDAAVERWAKANRVGIYKTELGWRANHADSGRSTTGLDKEQVAQALVKRVKVIKPLEDYYE